MKHAIVTGSYGLIGVETCSFFHDKGFSLIGIDNDMRAYFFGAEASSKRNHRYLQKELSNYTHFDLDIRDHVVIDQLFAKYTSDIDVVIHTAAQPSHDWAAQEPLTDFTINANGTLNLLEACRIHCPDAVFIFISTNKVYGDRPNMLPLIELDKRWEVEQSHTYFEHGIDEHMSIDDSTHSLFGASKVAADILVQEYGRYFGMKTVSFRGGCLTGPAHSGAELHGFLSYLIICAIKGTPYTIHGYKGKQVRDNINSKDLVSAFWHFYQNPKVGKAYNIGGSRHSNISILEAIDEIERLSGRRVNYTISQNSRKGDHIWYISDVRKFKSDYPDWSYEYNMEMTLKDMLQAAELLYTKDDILL